ncbi:hypothetical protein F5Y00DRAFT_262928 [Daldinia vernicosa]|uniref:uncharacterized protein n=1 Tax=Daldinia vernicosa TaxID=114800 RepID=UPI00200810EB|nr:uncharacterized protein F5Y00DRAFT_262928 [Daldinia vernicosa]KAI0848028.1 hypothetical protein F5Y00DRAFT_262928 [Daldinia vernicosa]
MVVNKTLVFKKIPAGLPMPGVRFEVEGRPFGLDLVPGGGAIVEVLSVSLDPYLRTRMRDASISMFSDPYIVYKIGKPKKGDIIFVSSAGGAVGSVVGQLDKREGMLEARTWKQRFSTSETLQKWIVEGSFKVKLHITHGINNAPEGFRELYQGKSFGKALVKIKE